MIEQLQYEPIISKLFDKSKAGKLSWYELEDGDSDQFFCDLDGQYIFSVWKKGDNYGLNMKRPSSPRVLFAMQVEDEIYFTDPRRKEMFDLLSDLYELARRKALNLPDRLATIAELLDKI